MAYHCGIPLRLPINGNNFGKFRSFLGGAVCLGDILHAQGYNQLSLIPHDEEFSGIGSFYKTHKINAKDERRFKEEQKLPSNYQGFWGIKDGAMLDLAKQELIRLSQENKPFALHVFAVDTHAQTGYFDPSVCPSRFENISENGKYRNAISCTDFLVGEFIQWVKQQDFYANTTIVILGDHLSHKQDFIPNGVERRIYNAFINPKFHNPIKLDQNRRFSHFDLFPTILDSLDVKIINDH